VPTSANLLSAGLSAPRSGVRWPLVYRAWAALSIRVHHLHPWYRRQRVPAARFRATTAFLTDPRSLPYNGSASPRQTTPEVHVRCAKEEDEDGSSDRCRGPCPGVLPAGHGRRGSFGSPAAAVSTPSSFSGSQRARTAGRSSRSWPMCSAPHPNAAARVVGVAVGTDTCETAAEFQQATGFTFPTGVDEQGEVRTSYQLKRVPSVILVDPHWDRPAQVYRQPRRVRAGGGHGARRD
jgi:hypothetical protein